MQNYKNCKYCGCKTTGFVCGCCVEKLVIVRQILKIGKSIVFSANKTIKNTQK